MNNNKCFLKNLVAIAVCFCAMLFVSWDPAKAGEVATFNEEFNGPGLDPDWIIWDGYAFNYPEDTENHVAFAMTGTQLSMSAAGGVEHNMWWLEHAQATRLFEGSGVYEIKVDSGFDGSQQFGLLFESGPGTFIILMLYADDRVWGYVERFVNVDGVQYKHDVSRAVVPLGMTLGWSFRLLVLTGSRRAQGRFKLLPIAIGSLNGLLDGSVGQRLSMACWKGWTPDC